MTIETIEVNGFLTALIGMRNPYDSWEKGDSGWNEEEDEYEIGPVDMDLSERLQKAGPEHAKHLRMIHVGANIVAPRFWWQEADTYRIGVEKNSCSTMHTLMRRPLTLDDFEHEKDVEYYLKQTIVSINELMEGYHSVKNQNPEWAKDIWRQVIQLLPQSYLQRRTVQFSYAALRNIVRQRKGHKLKEWAQFIDWCKTLPNAWMIFDDLTAESEK